MGVSLGFIGTGVIASAIVTGICAKGDLDYKIFLSPRNAGRAAELAKKFPNVTVTSSNQEVLDNTEWVVISVVPEIGEEVLKLLSFREDHRVINLMSDRKLPEVANWIGKTKSLVHMVPLPFISGRIGPIVIYPSDDDVESLFNPLGEIIAVNNLEKVEALAAITALMSSYYKLLWEIVKWGKEKGLTEKESLDYTTTFFKALSIQGRKDKNLDILVKEMTPGGLNEMALLTIKKEKSFEPWIEALELVIKRLKDRNT